MDYGTILSKLKPKLKKASISAYSDYYGTPKYLTILELRIHRAFDLFAEELEIKADKRNEFRLLLRDHVVNYGYVHACGVFYYLFYKLPNEFNVRGSWTSEYIEVYL